MVAGDYEGGRLRLKCGDPLPVRGGHGIHPLAE